VSRVLHVVAVVAIALASFVAGMRLSAHPSTKCWLEHDAGSPDAASVYCNRPLRLRYR
jgi:hypothetical protein